MTDATGRRIPQKIRPAHRGDVIRTDDHVLTADEQRSSQIGGAEDGESSSIPTPAVGSAASVIAHTLDYLDDGADVTFKRIAPLSGLVFVVLIVVTFVVLGGGASTPHNGASGAAIASFYTHHHATAITATFVLAVAVVPLLTFAATCLPVLQQRSRIWAIVFLGGAIASAACLLVTAATHYALAQGAHNNLDPAALQAINAIDQPAADAFAALAIMVLGAAGALIPSEQRRLRYLGYVAVVLAIIGLSPAGTTLFPLTAIWIAVLSVTLGVRADLTRDNVDRGTVPQPA